jgi:hypothetical protein
MDGTEDPHFKRNNADTERQMSHVVSHMRNPELKKKMV